MPYLEVYGGYLNVIDGTLVVTNKKIDMGSLSWTINANGCFYANIPDKAKTNSQNDVIADCYKQASMNGENSSIFLRMNDCEIAGFYAPQSSNSWVYVKDMRYDSKTDFEAWIAGHELVYELATPTTYQLSPTAIKTLLNTNNIFADTGDILSGEYWSKNPVTVTQAMLSTLRDAGEITPTEEPEEPEVNDER